MIIEYMRYKYHLVIKLNWILSYIRMKKLCTIVGIRIYKPCSDFKYNASLINQSTRNPLI